MAEESDDAQGWIKPKSRHRSSLHRKETQREPHERRGKKQGPGVEVRQPRMPSEVNGRREFSRGVPLAPAQGQRRHQAAAVQRGQAPAVRTASSLPANSQVDQVPVTPLKVAPKLRSWAAVLSPEAAKPEESAVSVAARLSQSVQPSKDKNLVDPAAESIKQAAAPSLQDDASKVESCRPSSTIPSASPWVSSTASGNPAVQGVAAVVPTATNTTTLEELVEGSSVLPTHSSLPAIVPPVRGELVLQSRTAENEACDSEFSQPQTITPDASDSRNTTAKVEEGATGPAGSKSAPDSRAIGTKEDHTVRPSQGTQAPQSAVDRRNSNGGRGHNMEPAQGLGGAPGYPRGLRPADFVHPAPPYAFIPYGVPIGPPPPYGMPQPMYGHPGGMPPWVAGQPQAPFYYPSFPSPQAGIPFAQVAYHYGGPLPPQGMPSQIPVTAVGNSVPVHGAHPRNPVQQPLHGHPTVAEPSALSPRPSLEHKETDATPAPSSENKAEDVPSAGVSKSNDASEEAAGKVADDDAAQEGQPVSQADQQTTTEEAASLTLRDRAEQSGTSSAASSQTQGGPDRSKAPRSWAALAATAPPPTRPGTTAARITRPSAVDGKLSNTRRSEVSGSAMEQASESNVASSHTSLLETSIADGNVTVDDETTVQALVSDGPVQTTPAATDRYAPSHSAKGRLADLFDSPDWLQVAEERFEPRGLLNPGNLCFASATVQALLACPAFCRLISLLPKDLDGYATLQALQALVRELTLWSADSGKRQVSGPRAVDSPTRSSSRTSGKGGPPSQLVQSGDPFTPTMLADVVARFAPRNPTGAPQQGEQQDAQEFLTFLVDAMHAELIALAKQEKWEVNGEPTASDGNAESGGDGWLTKSGRRTVRQNEILADTSPASSLFQGRIASCVSAAGTPPSVTIQPFAALGLHILHPGVQSIEDALDELTASETVSGYRPSPQAAPTTATKTLRIKSLPHLLTLHLMRFEFGMTTGANKVGKRIKFEPKLVISPRWMAAGSRDKGGTYELIATVTHKGAFSSSGHYTADVRHPTGRWVRFDDGDVFAVSVQQVLAERPYLLLYQRTSAGGKGRRAVAS